jgi:pyruvate formate lyase activating enzyme
MSETGIVFDIQRAALHDGPGLRTVVFLKGCPLRCAWCHNPESIRPEPQVGKSGKVYGKRMSVEEVMRELRKDKDYYWQSGGGITLSGGEPTFQWDFCQSLLHAAKAEGISTCLDTCGHFRPERLQVLLPLVDIWHFDYKLASGEDHRNATGVDGTLIMHNLWTLMETDARIRLRCPLIPGFNDSAAHRHQLDEFESSGRFETVERLPYHTLGSAKALDLDHSSGDELDNLKGQGNQI